MKPALLKIATLMPALLSAGTLCFGFKQDFVVNKKDIHDGYVYEKVWLSNYARPTVTLTTASYTIADTTGSNSPSQAIDIRLGMERKRPFAVIGIPAYHAGSDGKTLEQISSFSLDITEQAATTVTTAAKSTSVTTSALANGTWYKIGITKTGLYKLDAAFFTSMGVSLSSISPASIRILGNGGNMLSENNAVPRINDLAENAIWVNDGGDNAFNSGDYVVFYGVGPTAMEKDSINQRFTHTNNLYSDTAYYFISFNSGTGARVQNQAAAPAANITSTGFNFFAVNDADLVNPVAYGKTWLGEKFSPDVMLNTKSFSFDLGGNIDYVTARIAFACTQGNPGSTLTSSMNGTPLGTVQFNTVTKGNGPIITFLNPLYTVLCNSNTANFTLTFNASAGDPYAKGYLNYIEINGRRGLSINGNQMNFRDWQTVGSGKVASYTLSNANSFTRVWDVTNPQQPIQMQGTLGGSNYTFSQDAAMLHEFVAMNNDALYNAYYIGTVANQNLHGLSPVKMIIVTDPTMISAAQKLADYHQTHDNISSAIVTTAQVYNEFSSGAQDISGIRDFVRYMYKNAGTDTTKMPDYLLLLGSASYDYKHRLPDNSNIVPTFESANDSNDLSTFMSDDFYGFLDDSENIEDESVINTLDIGIGRITARNASVANDVVNKIIHYKSAETLGPWRLSTMFVADNYDDAGDHEGNAEDVCSTLNDNTRNLYNDQKVYMDIIPITKTPAGDRCPTVNTAINDQIYKGVFMMNYNGHGRHDLLAHERILTSDDYTTWNNKNMLPFMITATCDFGQFDHPEFISAAEQMLFDTKGGVIAMITTTQPVYSGLSQTLNTEYVSTQFSKKADGSWNTFGDAFRNGKNTTYKYSHSESTLVNFRKWTFLGDPALIPNFPEHKVVLDSIIDGATMEVADTVKALGKYVLKGSVRDQSNNVLNNFNGTVYMSFYDKPRQISYNIYSSTKTFKIQDNLIYKGKVSVSNGHFELTFISPKDINYFFGSGKVSTYAENGITDGAGMDTSVAVGGFSDHPVLNDNSPVVRPFIGDSLFINGGITGSTTSLYVVLTSETGINVSGYSIGHDLVGILDGNVESPYILNDYYETAPNTYQKGYVNYPISGLADGLHNIKVRAWDVNNNLGEGSVDFMVINGQVLVIDNLGNYPNPFSSSTHFVFEHNHPDEAMDVQINIFNTAGALARTIKQSFTPGGSRSADITWDGTDNSGAQLPSGVYVYRLNITTEKGFKSSAYQKLVIVR